MTDNDSTYHLPAPIIIAIDGPSASGKGTLAKKLAHYFGLGYLDTGKLYRAVGYKMLNENADLSSVQDAIHLASHLTLDDLENPELNTEDVGGAASVISAIPEVRDALLLFQKRFAARPEGAVLDGRDIGTVICPHADYKFYVTASLDTRAKRRFEELSKTNTSINYQDIYTDLKIRDERDQHRKTAPLKQAPDATFIDTTHLNVNSVFEKVAKLIVNAETSKYV